MKASIEDIFTNPDYSKLFEKGYLDKIIARPKSEDGENPPELLTAHSQITLKIFDRVVGELELEKIFANLLEQVFGKKDKKFWQIIRSIVYFHDFGKMNDAFQKRMEELGKNNPAYKTRDSEHALPGLFLFGLLLETYLKNEDDKTKATAFYLASVIARHHTNLQSPIDIGYCVDELWKKPEESEFRKLITKTYQEVQKSGQTHNLGLWFDPTQNKPSNQPGGIFRYFKDNLPTNSTQREALYYLHKLLYSCLVSSDYYAAHYRMDPEKVANTLSEIKKLKENLALKLDEKKSEEPASKAREKFRLVSHQRLSKSSGKKVFYLYLPTGGGKTLTSLSLALELAEKNNAKRLFYVFPFVNIIEQNHEVLKDMLGDELVSPIYSYSEWNLKEGENDKVHFINQEFTNYPVVILSNVNFFNALIKSGKNSNYKLHNFANSVIVIDEIQSLNAKEWTLYNDLIVNVAKMLNSKIIVMSATIPPIHELSEESEAIHEEVEILIAPDDAELKEEFKPFLNRVELILESKEQDISKLVEEKINEFENKEQKIPKKVLVVVNTIKKSIETFKELQKSKYLKEKYSDNAGEGKIILLNSTMLPSRRKEIIALIGKDDEDILLVSTQSVEAGLDVDFDLGIRELAPMDNLLQVCGRVNRHMKKEKEGKCKVYIATKNTEKDSIIYGDLKFRGANTKKNSANMQQKIKELLQETQTPMDEKYTRYSRELVGLIKAQNKERYRETQRHAVEGLRDLDFESLDEHKVIEQDSTSIFAPIDVELSQNEKDDSENKIGLLVLARAINEASSIKILEGNRLLSKNVLELYKSIATAKNRDKKIDLKKLAPLLNQFIFSVSHNRAHKLRMYTEEVFPDEKNPSSFLRLKDEEIETESKKGIYSLKYGLKIDELKDNEEAVVF